MKKGTTIEKEVLSLIKIYLLLSDYPEKLLEAGILSQSRFTVQE